MKKFLLLFALCGLFSFQAKAEGEVTDKITISELQTDDYGDTYFTVSLEGSENIYTAFQLTMEFPEGVIVPFFDGELAVYKCESSPIFKTRKGSTDHSVTGSFGAVGDRKLQIICASLSNKDFLATSGDLFDVYVVKESPYVNPEAKLQTSDLMFTVNLGTAGTDDYMLPEESYTVQLDNSSEISLNISATQQWNTCVLPFDAELPEGVRAFEGSSISGDYLILSEATSLQAFIPYILYAENGYEGTLSGTVDAEKYVTAATGAYLNGAIMPQEITEGYVMQDKGQGDGMMFYNVNNRSFTIPSGKCWVSAAASDAKAIRIGLGRTGIESLPSASQTEEGEVYTLDGKRVQNPQKGNVYIKGGKKVLYLK